VEASAYKRVREAVAELKGLIRSRYPKAKFALARDPDQRRSWLLWTIVDGIDPDDISALTRDRSLDMQVEEHIPLHVIPTTDRSLFAKSPQDGEQWRWAPYSRVKSAAEELKATISTRYPEARFKLGRAAYQPVGWDLEVSVDVEDPEDVTSMVIDRVVDMLAEEHIPIHVRVCQDRERIHRHLPKALRKTG